MMIYFHLWYWFSMIGSLFHFLKLSHYFKMKVLLVDSKELSMFIWDYILIEATMKWGVHFCLLQTREHMFEHMHCLLHVLDDMILHAFSATTLHIFCEMNLKYITKNATVLTTSYIRKQIFLCYSTLSVFVTSFPLWKSVPLSLMSTTISVVPLKIHQYIYLIPIKTIQLPLNTCKPFHMHIFM